jgi:hypothetical protein
MKTEATASPPALSLYQQAFPDFGDLDIQLPKGARDFSYKHDTCPSFIVKEFDEGTCLVLYVDYLKVEMREMAEARRFLVELRLGESELLNVLLTTEDYSDALALISLDKVGLWSAERR